ncbi:peroxisome assembly protein 26 [Esox lucius]|uniref:Peroxisome assembly protein 26 n=1 Tax=Esox lucius TaxID=8010 RepID=C1BZH6_ESOLU|nr:peroxisome assembly protein 26 [Esox lucius]ACO14429.1 Peroxisome assembly protein 26 [Esox lucius]
MRSNSSPSLTHTRSFVSVRQSLPLSSKLALTLSLLDSAAEQLMVLRDFRSAFNTCESGLESLRNADQEDSRYGELKMSLSVVGIQALAELNQWHGVLPWILHNYECPEKIPAKIMQMCLLLYTKVGEQAAMQEAGNVWLHFPSNRRLTGYGTVAELYLLHILVPLGHTKEARELIFEEVGSVAFAEDQKQTALDIVENKENLSQQQPANPSPDPSEVVVVGLATPQGAVIGSVEAMLRLLYRGLSVASTGTLHLRRFFLAVVILYILFVRMDTAHPSSFPWISRLIQVLNQMRDALFSP